MASFLYDSGLNSFARGETIWKAAGGSTIRAFLVTAGYVPSQASDVFLSAIGTGNRVGNGGQTARANAPQLTLLDPAAGVCDANDIVFTAMPAGGLYVAVVLFRDDGVADASSPLLVYLDNGLGLPISANGADENITWSNASNKIFRI